MAKHKQSKFPPELKLKALGLIADEVPLRDITEQLSISYPVLLKWRTELKEGIENRNLASIVELDETLVHGVAEKLAEDLIALDPSQSELIEGELLPVVEGLEGYKGLSVRLQTVALKLANKISAAAEDNPGADQIESLVTSLAKLQEAFFNKNQTQIAVFNTPTADSTGVSKFKGLQKS